MGGEKKEEKIIKSLTFVEVAGGKQKVLWEIDKPESKRLYLKTGTNDIKKGINTGQNHKSF